MKPAADPSRRTLTAAPLLLGASSLVLLLVAVG
jgi:hypothetical protein